jgi:hypothetical protein
VLSSCLVGDLSNSLQSDDFGEVFDCSARIINVSVAVVNALRGGEGSAEALVRVFLSALFVMNNRRFQLYICCNAADTSMLVTRG